MGAAGGVLRGGGGGVTLVSPSLKTSETKDSNSGWGMGANWGGMLGMWGLGDDRGSRYVDSSK